MYFDAMQSCVIMSEGKIREADYMMDCGYFEWYERQLHGIEYSKYISRQYKKGNDTDG